MSGPFHGKGVGPNPAENYQRFFIPVIGEPVAADLMEVAALRRGERVLDVGCGTGHVARLAHEAVGSEGSVDGLDPNPAMLAVARSIAPAGTRIGWHQAGAENMPLPDASYDAVLCQMSLQFMEDKPRALREMHRVLAPGGRVVLNLPGPAAPAFAALAEAMGRHISPQAAGFVQHVFSVHDTAEVERMLSEAGFREATARAEEKTLHLPEARAFLWQYVASTPLAQVVASADEAARESLESEVVERWRGLGRDGSLTCGQRMVTAAALK